MAERTLQQRLNHLLTTDPPLECGGYSVKRCDSWSADITKPSGETVTVRDKVWCRTVERIVSVIMEQALVLTCQFCHTPSEKPTCYRCAKQRATNQQAEKRLQEGYEVAS